ncbi:MAG: transcription termination/antitermination factor NusG [SAR202 cluster bacterium]|nr:transcription termination/antitermination factor NusG [SAR202 cluster bacterium]
MTTSKTSKTDTAAKNTQDARWYIVHTYSGQEERVKKNLELRINSLDMQDKILQVIVPTEEEIAIKDGKRRSERKKVFPGYILVQMKMDDESWYAVRNTPGVTGFVSTEDERDKRPKPIALEPKEVDAILAQIESGPPKITVGLQVGETVRITAGPFADFMGVVNDVDPDKARIRVLVSFFGRETPVELDFLQVEKV